METPPIVEEYWKHLAVVVAVLAAALLLYAVMTDDGENATDVPSEAEDRVSTWDSGFRIEGDGFLETAYFTGVYRGDIFTNQTYRDPPRMRFTQDLQPGDGVADVHVSGYILYEEGQPVFFADIYVDDDFREEVDGNLNVAWGTNFSDKFRQYQYEEVEPGVYKDTIRDENVARFRERGPGSDGEVNVAVGNFSHEDVLQQRTAGLTFMTVQ